MSVIAMMAALIAAPVAFDHGWGRFSRAEALRRVREEVEIGTLGLDPTTRRPFYWLRRTTTAMNGEPAVRWIDSRACPQVDAALAELAALPMPAFAPPGHEPGEVNIVLDGAGYIIDMPTTDSNGHMIRESNVGSPLARWVDATLDRTAPCLTLTPPPPQR